MPNIIAKAASIRDFAHSTGGMAAVEFAMILPVLSVMFLATIDGGRALATYMKVRASTYALAEIANQYLTIQSSDMTSIMGATTTIMAPYPSSPLVSTISQIKIDSKGNATISWSYSQGGTARTLGSSIAVPTALDLNNSYLLLAETSYTFSPLFGFFSSVAMTFSDNLYVTPRISNCINYPPQSVAGCVGG
jgi:Flp pilus assembly protein TadG